MTELGDVERQRCTEFVIACGKNDKASRSARVNLGRARVGKSLIMHLLALLLFGVVHGLHPRSKHLGRYDFVQLVEVNPALRPLTFVSEKTGDQTVDWGNRDAVFQLNKALLMHHYGVSNAYDVPSGWLVPPVPSRADCVHVIADLIFEEGCTDPASSVVGLDIGTGANTIFPLIASAEFGWKMVGTETNIQALAIARKNVLATSHSLISLRHQPNPLHFFKNVVADGERFNFCICNPPFYSSKAEAQAASDRKTHNLGLVRGRGNFEGQSAELWCRGGEAAFISGMIDESATHEFRGRLGWLASLVSNRRNLRPLQDLLVSRKSSKSLVREISTGNKMATVLAWRFD